MSGFILLNQGEMYQRQKKHAKTTSGSTDQG